jgi:MinD superfamily P-loop ATPase
MRNSGGKCVSRPSDQPKICKGCSVMVGRGPRKAAENNARDAGRARKFASNRTYRDARRPIGREAIDAG